ncbi:hypothetical protein [Streptomyces rubrogriseus]|uniref:hypothetical protein n=1 Tax=Streptomyces rubrogriseus TaxID=194673 RepID=UPI0037F5B618
MPDSDSDRLSQRSSSSNASYYSAGHILRNSDGSMTWGYQPDIRVPEYAPEPSSSPNVTPMYVANPGAETGAFYQVNAAKGKVWRWAEDSAKWVSEHRKRIATALIDSAPTLVQGASSFLPDSVSGKVNAAGIGLQGLVGAKELYDQYTESRAGAHVDPWQATTAATRLASSGLNAASAALGDNHVGTRLGGVGTWTAAAATVADLVHHAHVDPQRQPQDADVEMYGLYRNPQLGNGPGQYPPGYQASVSQDSSASSVPVSWHGLDDQAFDMASMSAGLSDSASYADWTNQPVGTSAADYSPAPSAAGPSNSQQLHERHRAKGERHKSKGKGKDTAAMDTSKGKEKARGRRG